MISGFRFFGKDWSAVTSDETKRFNMGPWSAGRKLINRSTSSGHARDELAEAGVGFPMSVN
jgi:hypothetical protein